MTLYALKPRLVSVCRPLARRFVSIGVTANQVTVATALLSVAVGIFVAVSAARPAVFWLIPLVLLLRIPFNAVDGLMAREFRQRSSLGAYLNELGDVVSDVALMLPFAFVPPLSVASVGSLVLLAVLTEFAGVLAWGIGGERQYQGPLGKSDRALLLGALGAWIGSGQTLPDQALWAMPVLAILLILTIVRRVRAGLRSGERARAPGACRISAEHGT